MQVERRGRKRGIATVAARLAGLPRPLLVLLGLLLVCVIAYLDFTSPSRLVVSIFYLLPVMLVAWLSGSTLCGLIVAGATFQQNPRQRPHRLPLPHTAARPVERAMRFAVFGIVLSLMAEVRRLLAQLEAQARTDELTGLANLRALHEVAAKEIARSTRFDHPLTLAYLDIDHFKEVNDRAGHAAGDRVLIALASVASKATRTVDTVARVGGDEFVVLMPETKPDAALLWRTACARCSRKQPPPSAMSV